MASRGVNKVILVGNLGNDPEVRYMPNGNAVANLSLATSESWKDQQGQLQERTEWHRVTMYRRLAEVAGEYLKKGSQIYIEGKLQTRKWQDQQGQDRYTTEIIADQMQMLGSRGGQAEGGYQPQQRPAQQPQYQQAPQQAPQQYQQAPAQTVPAQPAQQAAPAAPAYQQSQQGAGFNQPAAGQPAAGQPAKQPPMAEPDFDFDDDIPF